MRHESHAEGCRVCDIVAGLEPEGLVFSDARWQLASLPPPVPLPGWIMLIARRHVAGPGAFDDAEAAGFGPALRHAARLVQRETGALRVYTAALGEADPHFHAHLVPRYAELPGGAKGFGVFDLQRQAQAGTLTIDAAANEAMLGRLREAFAREPLP